MVSMLLENAALRRLILPAVLRELFVTGSVLMQFFVTNVDDFFAIFMKDPKMIAKIFEKYEFTIFVPICAETAAECRKSVENRENVLQ